MSNLSNRRRSKSEDSLDVSEGAAKASGVAYLGKVFSAHTTGPDGQEGHHIHQHIGKPSSIEEKDTPRPPIISTSSSSSTSSKSKRKFHEKRRVVFIFGAFLGLFLTIGYSTYYNPSIKNEIDKIVRIDRFNDFFEDWKDWKDILPVGLQSILSEQLGQKDDALQYSPDSFSVGRRLAATMNLTSEYNVLLVPGVISTGIESWGVSTEGDCPSISHFRKRLWGSFYMLRTMVLDKKCWLKHIMLDPVTGLDPHNIKMRAAQGFEAADYFMVGYWIWNKILQNLAVIGYGPNTMQVASYDWRLAFLDLEKRDGYFSKIKSQIEVTKNLNGKKSIIVGHSMGAQISYYFLKWVEAENYGGGGPNWVNDHIEAFVDISGSTLGTPKSIPALLSGEMKDTVQLNALAVYGLEQFFSRKERVDLLRTFGGIAGMLPKGGSTIWGDLERAPDDDISDYSEDVEGAIKKNNDSFGNFIRHKKKDGTVSNFTIEQSIDMLLDESPNWYKERVEHQYSYGIAKTKEELERNNKDHSKFSNPLEAALPNAPDMKIFCFYGVGKPTERAYNYVDADSQTGLHKVIDPDAETPVYLGDGDGTVSLLAHTMCHEWKKGSESRYNPSGIPVTIVEIMNEPDRYDIRGGAKTADHVDILGSAELNELVLRVAAGVGDGIEDHYVSNLRYIAEKMAI
ncbi:hypothetical protein G9P44_004531 [Scheffersomyces stipitis]|nr:hypothetical protein G9P44_004531 [Scheffersomyces stipitis]